MRKLILTGDDFGRSHAINEAIERHHQAGVLTQASLMVNEAAVDEAVRIAQRNPALCVGLHLTLCDGRSSVPSALHGGGAELIKSPVMAGLRLALLRQLAAPLRREIGAQFERFIGLGLPTIYWDGHAHLHLHPAVLRVSLPIAASGAFRFTRLVRTPDSLALLSLVFRALSRSALPQLKRHNIRYADHVCGLPETGRMNTAAMQRLIAALPIGVSEIYFHPGAEPEPLDTGQLLDQIGKGDVELTNSERLLVATE